MSARETVNEWSDGMVITPSHRRVIETLTRELQAKTEECERLKADIKAICEESADKDRQISEADAEIAHLKDVLAMTREADDKIIAENDRLRADNEKLRELLRVFVNAVNCRATIGQLNKVVDEASEILKSHAPFSPLGPVREEDGISEKGE